MEQKKQESREQQAKDEISLCFSFRFVFVAPPHPLPFLPKAILYMHLYRYVDM